MEILEVKRRLDGSVATYPCRAAEVAADRAILLYTLPRPGRVGDLDLPAGTLTVAYYWAARPYNVYHWIAPAEAGAGAVLEAGAAPEGGAARGAGATLAYYFNLSGPVRIARDRVEWDDLEVDVLVTPDGRTRVLDEDRVPPTAAGRRDEIARARARVLAEWSAVSREVEAASRALLGRDAVPGRDEQPRSRDATRPARG